jgi:phosphatidylglycerophosphatase A
MNPALRLLMRQLPDRVVLGVCTGGPVGHWGPFPGTNGTVLGLILYTVIFYRIGWVGELIFGAALIGLAILFCDEGERRLQKRDPGEILIDEVVAVPICFLGMSPAIMASGHVWLYMLAGFFLFRFFDILKPLGINRLQRYPGGLGVVLDDLGAAVAVNLTLRVLELALATGGW